MGGSCPHFPLCGGCTLLDVPYDAQFELGPTLQDAARPVPLNHPHCARFCVLGGASCSARVNGASTVNELLPVTAL